VRHNTDYTIVLIVLAPNASTAQYYKVSARDLEITENIKFVASFVYCRKAIRRQMSIEHCIIFRALYCICDANIIVDSRQISFI